MTEIRNESHTDRIGRNQEINITILVVNLRIAGTRAEPAHYNGRPTTLAAHKIGDLVISATPGQRSRFAAAGASACAVGIGQL